MYFVNKLEKLFSPIENLNYIIEKKPLLKLTCPLNNRLTNMNAIFGSVVFTFKP